MYRIKSLIVLTVLVCGTAIAQNETDKPHDPQIDQEQVHQRSSSLTSSYDVKYHRLELEVNPPVIYIEGNVTTYFVPQSDMGAIYFDFRNNMTVDSVVYHGSILTHAFSSSVELKVDFPSVLSVGILDSLTVFYHGAPNGGGFGSFATEKTTCSSVDSVMWTLSEPYGAKNWWPCKETLNDKVDSVELLITAPLKYHIGSNGLLISRDTVGNKITDHWKHKYPIPAYLVAFAASEYAIYKDTIDLFNGGQLEVLNYVFPCDSATARSQTRKLDTVMNFFIDKLGPYPYEKEKYGHAQCRFGGGMEHTTMTFMGGWWTWILIHELAHQWFGDKITCGSWQDIWLNEGFATYMEGLTCEQGIGAQAFSSWLGGKRNNILSSNYGSVYCPDTTSVGRIFSSRLSYSKGAYLLHMLRWIIGDDDFFAGLHNYINDSQLAYDYALTPQFQAHMETVADTNLTEFFDDWYLAEGWPDYNVVWSVDVSCSNKLRVNIEQSHSAGGNTFFEMPVPIRFSSATQDTTLVFYQNNPQDTLFFDRIDFVPNNAVFDPDRWLCAQNTIVQESLPVKTIHWTGSGDNNWNSIANWDCDIPSDNDEVVIPAGQPDCIIPAGAVTNCKRIFIEDGAVLTIEPGATLNVLQ